MSIEIKHRFTNAVLHTVKADTLSGADLSGAYLSGADLRGASLSEANLAGADLRWSALSWADLSWANLSWANLSGADLSGANLSGAVINADKLSRILARVTRVSDGHEFFLFALQNGPAKIKAGCRWLTIADYRTHVADNYPDTEKARKTLAILNYCEACTHD